MMQVKEQISHNLTEFISGVISTTVKIPKLCIRWMSDGFRISQSLYLLLHIKSRVEVERTICPTFITGAGVRSEDSVQM